MPDTVDSLDYASLFLKAASIPREGDHRSGTLEEAESILHGHPDVGGADIYTAAVLGHASDVRRFLADDPESATRKAGPYEWDALTYLCFSRYLRLDQTRSAQFVEAARALLDAGADANTGWTETIDQPNDRQILESVIYGAAAVAGNAALTQLLVDYGADPNDEETPYHVPENYDNTVMKLLLKSGRWNARSLSWLLVRKADVHDMAGLRMALEGGADPNLLTRWGVTGLHQAVRRDNSLEAIALLLDHGADPLVKDAHYGFSAAAWAAFRGRCDVLTLLENRGANLQWMGMEALLAACAKGDGETALALATSQPPAKQQLLAMGGTLLAQFAGNGNVPGIRCLLRLGVSVDALYHEGDGYFDIAKNSSALHVAAWRARHEAVKELIEQGAPVNLLDGQGRSALMLAVKACVDSYWMNRRSPDSVNSLLDAGAALKGVTVPTGYKAVDEALQCFPIER